jgi:hypothetical protein
MTPQIRPSFDEESRTPRGRPAALPRGQSETTVPRSVNAAIPTAQTRRLRSGSGGNATLPPIQAPTTTTETSDFGPPLDSSLPREHHSLPALRSDRPRMTGPRTSDTSPPSLGARTRGTRPRPTPGSAPSHHGHPRVHHRQRSLHRLNHSTLLCLRLHTLPSDMAPPTTRRYPLTRTRPLHLLHLLPTSASPLRALAQRARFHQEQRHHQHQASTRHDPECIHRQQQCYINNETQAPLGR